MRQKQIKQLFSHCTSIGQHRTWFLEDGWQMKQVFCWPELTARRGTQDVLISTSNSAYSLRTSAMYTDCSQCWPQHDHSNIHLQSKRGNSANIHQLSNGFLRKCVWASCLFVCLCTHWGEAWYSKRPEVGIRSPWNRSHRWFWAIIRVLGTGPRSLRGLHGLLTVEPLF